MSEHFDALLNKEIEIGFKRLSDNATIPTKAHPTDSGFDLYAAEDTIIEPGETVIIPTNIAVQLPQGYEAQVRPRSGVTAKTKLRVQLGTIDNGYSGDIGVIVDNIFPDIYAGLGSFIFDIEGEPEAYLKDGGVELGANLVRKGDRIAQLVVQKLPSVQAVEIDSLSETARGEGGFGSTGVNNDG